MDEDELDLKRREYEMNHKIDAILAQNPDKMPSAVYYISKKLAGAERNDG